MPLFDNFAKGQDKLYGRFFVISDKWQQFSSKWPAFALILALSLLERNWIIQIKQAL